MGNPIEERAKEDELRPAAVAEIVETISHYRTLATSTDPAYEHIEPEEKAKVSPSRVPIQSTWIQKDKTYFYLPMLNGAGISPLASLLLVLWLVFYSNTSITKPIFYLVAQVLKEVEDAATWLSDKSNQQSKLAKYDPPSVLAAELLRKKEALERYVVAVLHPMCSPFGFSMFSFPFIF